MGVHSRLLSAWRDLYTEAEGSSFLLFYILLALQSTLFVGACFAAEGSSVKCPADSIACVIGKAASDLGAPDLRGLNEGETSDVQGWIHSLAFLLWLIVTSCESVRLLLLFACGKSSADSAPSALARAVVVQLQLAGALAFRYGATITHLYLHEPGIHSALAPLLYLPLAIMFVVVCLTNVHHVHTGKATTVRFAGKGRAVAVLLSTGAGLGTGILLSPAQHHVAVEVGCLLLAVSAAQVYVSVTLPELMHPPTHAVEVATYSAQLAFCTSSTLGMATNPEGAGTSGRFLGHVLFAAAVGLTAYYMMQGRYRAQLAHGWQASKTPTELVAWTYLVRHARTAAPEVQGLVHMQWARTAAAQAGHAPGGPMQEQYHLLPTGSTMSQAVLHSQCEELVLHSLRWGVQHFHGSALMHINMAWMTVHFLRTAEAHGSGPGQGAAVRVQGLSTAPLRHLHRAVSSLAWYEVDGWLLALRCTLKVRALLDATVAAGSSGERAAGLSSTAGSLQAFQGAAASAMTPSSASVHGASMDGSTISSTLDDRNEGRQPTMRRVSPTSLHGFREALQAALSADEGAMRHLLAAWNAMADAEGTSAQATASAESFADLVAQAHVHYAAAVARNPESSTAYQYYGDFLANVVGLKAEAAFCTSRADALHRIAAQRQHAEQVLTVQDIQLGKVRHGVVPPSDDDELEPQLTLSGDVDAGFPIIAANAAAARMFGRHPHDVLGASVGALFPAAISGAVVRALGFAVSGIDVGAGAGARRPHKVGGMRTTPAGIALGQYQLWLGWHASRRCLVPMLMCISEHFGSATGADLAKLTVPQLEVSLREVRTSSALFLVDCAGVKSAPASDSGAAARRADGLLASTLSRFAACPVVGACEAGLALTGLGSRKTDFAAAQVTVGSVFKAAGPKGSTPKGQSLSDLGDDSRDLPRIDITHAVHGTTTPALARFTLAHLWDGEEALVQHSGRSSQPEHDQGGGQAVMSSTTLQSRAGGLPFHGMRGSRPHLRGADLLADSKAHPARQAEGSLHELSTDPHSLGQGMGRVSPTPHTLHDDCGPAPPANTGTAPHLAPAPRSQASSVTSSSHAMRGVASLRLSLLRVGADKQATEACKVWGTDTGQRARAVYRDVTLAKIVVGSLFFTLVSMIVLTSFGSSLDGALLVVLESLSTGLWAAGVRLLSSKLVTSAHSRMLTQATFLAEPEQLTLLELGALTADMDMAASAMRASDSRTADIIQAIIASRGIDTDAAYVPPANASEAAILSAFAENADSLAFPSDRMRWVPLSDAGSASVIMSTFEVGQWCAHMLRSITQLGSAAAFSNSSAVATYDAAMPDRVWPAFNASVRARAGMLQSFTGREYVEGSGSVDTLLFATLPLLCVVLGMSLMCSLAGTFSDDLLQPLLAVRSLQKPAMKQLQRRTIERLADIGARQGGSGRSADDGMELLLSDMEAEGDYSDVEAGDATFETDHVHLASTGMTSKPLPHRKLQAASVKDIPAAHGKPPAPDRHHARNAAGKRSGSQRALYKGGGMQYRQGACGLREGRLQCLGTGCCASLPFVLVMLSIMVLLTWVYVAGNGGVLMATSRLVLVQSAALQAVHFRMAVHDAVRGADAQAPGRAQAAQAAFLADMGHLLHGTAAGPMGTPLAPLPADDALMGLLVQDACLPPALARWQVNCSSAFNGVAATGGTLQVYLRLFSEGNQMLATLDEQGGFQAGANRYASSPRLQQGMVAMTSLEKGLARDAMRVAAATLKDQAVGTATGLTQSKNSSIAIGWLVLLAALVVQVRFLAAGGRRLVAVRSLLLQLPQDLLHNKTDALGAVVADCMSKHSKQAVQGKTWE